MKYSNIVEVYECLICERKCLIFTNEKDSPYECPYNEANYCWEKID